MLMALASISIYFQSKMVIDEKDSEILNLTKKNASLISEMESKLSAADRKAKDLEIRNQQISNEANTKIQVLSSEANEKLQLANQPEATVFVTFRKAFFGNGNVARIKNTGAQASPFALQFIRASTNQQRSFQVVVDQERSIEIGEREGWAFLSGDEIKVSQPGHKPMTFKFQ